jgi:predicted glycosyltransferase
MNPPRTILFQPQNHVGMGHMNRLAAVALAIRQMDASVRTPFVVEGASHVLLDALGLPYTPIPSSHLLYETEDWSQWPRQERIDLQVRISRTVLESIGPQLVVFDFLPSEAFASAVMEKKLPIVLCLRQTKHLDLQLQRMRNLLPHVCRVLIPHPEGAFAIPSDLREKSRFIGTIARQNDTPPRRVDEADCFEVVISGGGGGHPDTADFFNLAMQAIARIRESGTRLRVRLITGPLFTAWPRLNIVSGIVIVPFDPALVTTFDSADLVICQAGYNTIAELEQITARAIVMPRPRRWDNQFDRAERVAGDNPHIRVFRGSTANELAGAMIEFLGQPVLLNKNKNGRQEGARKAAEELLDLVRVPVDA